MCGAVWCGAVLKFCQNHNRTAPHFCSHICDAVYKMWFEWFEIVIYFKFWVFTTQPKTNFPFILVQVLNYWASFSLFWAGFLKQHLLELSFFFLKTRVIKLLIIYLILKKLNILIYREGVVRCSLYSFLIIKSQITLHHVVRCTITCSVVRLCHFAGSFGAVFAVRAVYTVLWTPLLATYLVLKFKWEIKLANCFFAKKSTLKY